LDWWLKAKSDEEGALNPLRGLLTSVQAKAFDRLQLLVCAQSGHYLHRPEVTIKLHYAYRFYTLMHFQVRILAFLLFEGLVTLAIEYAGHQSRTDAYGVVDFRSSESALRAVHHGNDQFHSDHLQAIVATQLSLPARLKVQTLKTCSSFPRWPLATRPVYMPTASRHATVKIEPRTDQDDPWDVWSGLANALKGFAQEQSQ
jgi:hypothetical protein